MNKTNQSSVNSELKDIIIDEFKIIPKVVSVSAINSTNAIMLIKEKYPRWYCYQMKLVKENTYKFLLFKRKKRGRKCQH